MKPLLELAVRAARQSLTDPPFCDLPAKSPSLESSIVELFLAGAMYSTLIQLGYTDEDALHWLERDGAA